MMMDEKARHVGQDTDWPQAVHRVLCDAGIRQVAYVPDAGLSQLIELCRGDPEMRSVVLSSEEEGVALLGGAWLGGERGILLMQSSGVGNCINMLATIKTCAMPFLALVTMRGEWAEFNPWQLPMGQTAGKALELAGVIVERAERRDEVAEKVEAAATMAFHSQTAVAVLVPQRLIGRKRW